MGDRMATRSLPVLDLAPPVAAPTGPRAPMAPVDERLEQFRPEVRSLPSFFVWTLGCQLNQRDSEASSVGTGSPSSQRHSKQTETYWSTLPSGYETVVRAGSEYTPISRTTSVRHPVSSSISRTIAWAALSSSSI